jgi:hypothetical protein
MVYASDQEQISQDLVQLLEQLETNELATLLGTLSNNVQMSSLLVQLSALEDNQLQSLIDQIEQ